MSNFLVFDLAWMASEDAQTVVVPTCRRVARSVAAFWSEPSTASHPSRWRGSRNPFRTLPTSEELISQKYVMSKKSIAISINK